MGYKHFIRKIAKFILNSQPEKKVTIVTQQINYGGILQDKRIVVTGGGKGIGFAIAEKCIREGAKVLITGRDSTRLNVAASKLGERCSFLQYDVTEVDKASRFLEDVESKLGGPIDILVNNAGISLHEGTFLEVTPKGFESQFRTNFEAGYFLSKSYLSEQLKRQLTGQVLFITSEAADENFDIPYGLTKSALNSLIGALSRRVYKNGIRINGIAPGVTVSDMTKDYAATDDGNFYRRSASDRTFLPSEVAEVACFIMSDAAKCISGEVVHCNAGNHLRPFWED